MDDFLKKLAAVLELETIEPHDSLKAFPLLDSLGVLSIIAMLDTEYGVNIHTADVMRMATPEELWNHVLQIKNSEKHCT
jgi:acyl carrier protein